jgi:hypothetical protein
MKSFDSVVFVLSFSLMTTSLSWGAEKAVTFDSYKFVRTRNVFDPSRVPGRAISSANKELDVGDLYTLTGTLQQENKAFAFFSGTKQSKVIPLQGTLVGAKVVSIQNTKAELERDGKHITLQVGNQLRIQDDGTMEVVSNSESSAEISSTSSDAKSSSHTVPATSGETSDLIKKMIEKRQQELSK